MIEMLALMLGCGAAAPTEQSTAPSHTDAPFDAPEPVPGDPPVDPCGELLQAPQAPVGPQPGELFYVQIGLGGVSLGESALIVGPDGTRILVDAGNDAHDDDILQTLADVTVLMDQAGFPAVSATEVDHVVITHLHADHADGLQDLLGNVSIRGKVLHRGLLDLTPAANTATVAQLCASLASAPGTSTPLCEGIEPATCDSGSWIGTYPSSGCPGLGTPAARLSLGPGAGLEIVAINGHIDGTSFQAEVGALLTTDLNGENARSAIGVVAHGDFRLLVSGDITAQSTDSDPVEEFYAGHILAAGGLDSRGVDVVHLSHHGRDSSNSQEWLDVLAPADGLSRNAIIGISSAHLGSPHAVVLERTLAGARLGEGRIWATTIALGGAEDAALVSAGGGSIRIVTREGGRQYVVQALDGSGGLIESRAFHAVGTCGSEP